MRRAEVAIIGMAGRFPGAPDIDAFWKNICRRVESIVRFTAEDLEASGIDPALLSDPDYVPMGAPLAEAECFDAAFFGYHPLEARMMDPQHRLVLECAWAALEDAGIDPERFDGKIGVFAGVARNTYQLHLLANRPDLIESAGEYQSMIAGEKDFVATRLAYKLDLRGPAVNVQTACSTTGVAVHLACQSLGAGDCDVALVAGARVLVPARAGYFYEEGGILSPDGRCRAFDAEARGTVRGSGVGVLALRRLEDALRHRDNVRAIVKGSAVNNDGSAKVGFSAPGLDGQAAAVAEALASAGLDAGAVGYIEAHGTGTSIGDPIEIAALTRAFRKTSKGIGYCALGSVKANIGHLDAGAAVAGIIKTVQALEHRQLPPSPNFQRPSPEIDFARSPFFVPEVLSEWASEAPRRAGVSSFGLGGTNAHIILEEAPRPEPAAPSRPCQLLVLSARTEAALDGMRSRLAEHIRERPEIDLPDVAYTLQTGRTRFAHRRIAVCRNREEALASLAETSGRGLSRADGSADRPVAFLFPGGGAQYASMGRELYRTEPAYRERVDECVRLLEQLMDLDMRSVLIASGHGEDAGEALVEPSRALPALFVTEYALAGLLISWGIRPAAVMGHSTGEYTAACLAEVLSLEDALSLVAIRSRLFEQVREGGMVSVALAESEVLPLLGDDLSIAAVNGPKLCAVSGPLAAIEALESELERREVDVRRVPILVAAHSALVEPILEEYEAHVRAVSMRPPRYPYLSCVTGTWARDEVADPSYWVTHLRRAVRFSDALGTLFQDPRVCLAEIGPGQTLSGLARLHPGAPGHEIVSTMRHPKQMTPSDDQVLLTALGRLWLAGGRIDWTSFWGREQRRRVPLPTYPFERVRHWVDPVARKVVAARPPGAAVAETAPSPTPVAGQAPGAVDRRGRIIAALKRLFGDVTGLDPAAMPESASFLELGFESLALTQASLAVKRELGPTISFRRFMEDLSTLDALASHLDAELPGDRMAEPVPAAAPPGASREPAAAAPETPVACGPWKPLDRRQAEALTPEQRVHLDALTARWNARTAGSKRLAQQSRDPMADPRTAAGFSQTFKELCYPIVAARSAGSRIWDVDGNEFIDVAMGFGVNLFGHSPPFIAAAVKEQIDRGFEIGPQSPLAGDVARRIRDLTGMERVAFCNTGSESVLAALRMARTVTGRSRIALFAGSYHGLFDEVLVRPVDRDGRRRSVPIAPGIPPWMVEGVLVLDYDDPGSLQKIRENAGELAAVIVEPVQSRHPDLQPAAFLRELRALTQELDVPLIFDEMITGFRSHPGGVQALFDVRADLATYGKVVGGGFPIGVVAGKRRFMDALDGGAWRYGDDSRPEVGVTWFAGTFVRHPIALAAARAALGHLQEQGPGLQAELNARTATFVAGLRAFLEDCGAPIRIEHFSSFFLIRFEGKKEHESLLYHHLKDQGIHITEGRSAFLSTAHSDEDLARIAAAFKSSVLAMQAGGFLTGRSAERAAPVEAVPLTEAQEEIWLATRLDPEVRCAFNLSNVLRLGGPLDAASLRGALEQVVHRHEALRTTIREDGRHQVVAPRDRVELPLVDLTDLDETDRAERLEELRTLAVTTPFDLATGPLHRAQLIRLADESHLLFLTVHHIICDGWSSGAVFRDLGAFYTALRRGRPANLPAAQSYAEYARRQHALRGGPGREATEGYWLSRFADGVPVFDLPTDRPRPPVKTYRAHRQERRIDGALCAELRALASTRGSTLFALLLGAYEVLVSRLSGQRDIVLGVSAAGQVANGTPDLVGHCVNLLPLRRRLDLAASFEAHLAGARGEILDAFEHQEYTFGSLVKALRVVRDPGRLPIVSVVFNMDSAMRGVAFDGLTVEAGSNPRRYENFDVFLNVVQTGTGLVVECTYNTDLFDGATIARQLEELEVLLRGVAADPSRPLGKLPILAAGERRQLLHEWLETERPFPRGACLHQLFEGQVEKTPDAVALVHEDDELTYAELDRRANRIAWRLLDVGLEPDTVVAVCLERGPDLVAAILGILKAGGAYLPIETAYPAERTAFVLSDSRCPVVVTRQALADRFAGSAARLLPIDAVDAAGPGAPASRPLTQVGPGNLAYVIYTSGSTGRPKGVAIEHRSAVALMAWSREMFTPEELGGVLAASSIGFDMSVPELFMALTAGGKVILAEDALALPRLPRAGDVRLISSQPSVMAALLRAGGIPDTVRTIYLGGERFRPSLVREILAGTRCRRVIDVYGPTEDTVISTCTERLADTPETIGRSISNKKALVLDEHLQPVPIGVAGELCLAGEGLAREYLNRPELTAERFVEIALDDGMTPMRVYRTGDRARFRADGRLEFLGRRDDQVKIRGHRIELGEIEATLLQHPEVRQAVAMVRADREDDPRLVAYVVADGGNGSAASRSEALQAFLGGKLPRYMVPSAIVALAQIPRTASGKVDRDALAAPERATVERFVPPSTPTEGRLARIWADVLGVARIGVHDDFFDLGGHSLLAAHVAARVREDLQVTIPIRQLFESPTLFALARHVDSVRAATRPIPRAHGGHRLEREELEL